MKAERICSIVDVPVLVRIQHGHLDPIYRVEGAAESREKLTVSISVGWQDEGTIDFAHLYNYASLYKLLQAKHDAIISGPIEGFIDELEKEVSASTSAQAIRLTHTHITLVRPDLLHGFVRLQKIKKYD